jgi:hypothetical protein
MASGGVPRSGVIRCRENTAPPTSDHVTVAQATDTRMQTCGTGVEEAVGNSDDSGREVALEQGLPVLDTVDHVVELQRTVGRVYIRYSLGPAADAAEKSVDKESGCALPGLSANPVTPEPWWDRPAEHWVARQLCQYDHLADRPGTVGWLLTGTEVGRGPDCEPLIAEAVALAVISPDCQNQAKEIYQATFAPGRR